jgi:predicted HTH transcriptional regulator
LIIKAVAVAIALIYYIVFQSFAAECSQFANREHLQQDIQSFVDSQNEVGRKTSHSREKILELLRENPKLTTASLAQEVGISPKGIEKQLAHLKREGLLRRIGPDKGGHWEVVDL